MRLAAQLSADVPDDFAVKLDMLGMPGPAFGSKLLSGPQIVYDSMHAD